MTAAALFVFVLTALAGAALSALPTGEAPDTAPSPPSGVPARWPKVWRAGVPVVLLGATALLAVSAPAAHGVAAGVARVVAVFAAMTGGSVCVAAAFALARAGGARSAPRSGAGPRGSPIPPGGSPPDGAPPPDEPALRGGLTIGVLERAAIAVCVLTGFGAGLAVIVAVKGLARYPELRDPRASEQFIIGTFVSVLWAVACAGTAEALVR